MAEINGRAMVAPRGMVELTTARLGGNAVLLGAAELALAATLQDPASVPVRTDIDSGERSS